MEHTQHDKVHNQNQRVTELNNKNKGKVTEVIEMIDEDREPKEAETKAEGWKEDQQKLAAKGIMNVDATKVGNKDEEESENEQPPNVQNG